MGPSSSGRDAIKASAGKNRKKFKCVSPMCFRLIPCEYVYVYVCICMCVYVYVYVCVVLCCVMLCYVMLCCVV